MIDVTEPMARTGGTSPHANHVQHEAGVEQARDELVGSAPGDEAVCTEIAAMPHPAQALDQLVTRLG